MAVGDTALLVELGDAIDEALNARVLELATLLRAAALPGLVELVPTYRSLLLRFDPDRLPRGELEEAVRTRLPQLKGTPPDGRVWAMPVVYGGVFGEDLAEFAAFHGISVDELVARHSAPTYRVYMIGFQPGFAYLGGLDPRLARPRRTAPRARTPAGSVSIGGIQAAVASVEAPSGWHLLGRTPARLFMPEREPLFLLAPGDRVRFQPVPADRWPELDAAAAAGRLPPELAS